MAERIGDPEPLRVVPAVPDQDVLAVSRDVADARVGLRIPGDGLVGLADREGRRKPSARLGGSEEHPGQGAAAVLPAEPRLEHRGHPGAPRGEDRPAGLQHHDRPRLGAGHRPDQRVTIDAVALPVVQVEPRLVDPLPRPVAHDDDRHVGRLRDAGGAQAVGAVVVADAAGAEPGAQAVECGRRAEGRDPAGAPAADESIGLGTDDGEGTHPTGVERKQPAPVPEQHRALLGQRARRRVVPTLIDEPIVVGERVAVEEAEGEHRAQDAAGVLIDDGLARGPGEQGRTHELGTEDAAGEDVEIESGTERARGALGRVVVGEHDAAEAEVPSQEIGEQVGVLAGEGPVHARVGTHDGAHPGADRLLERGRVELPERPLAHPGVEAGATADLGARRRVGCALALLVVDREVLHVPDDALRLDPARPAGGEHAGEVRVLPEVLEGAPVPSRPQEVDRRGEDDVVALLPRFVTDDPRVNGGEVR